MKKPVPPDPKKTKMRLGAPVAKAIGSGKRAKPMNLGSGATPIKDYAAPRLPALRKGGKVSKGKC